MTATYEPILAEWTTLVRSIGGEATTPDDYGVDFNNAILGDPYLEGTGYLPDEDTALAVATMLGDLLTDIAKLALVEQPELGSGWNNPEHEVATFAYFGRPEEGDHDYEMIQLGDYGLWQPARAFNYEQLSTIQRLFAEVGSALTERGGRGVTTWGNPYEAEIET